MYPVPEVKRQGIYHRVSKGETLWRIAKHYNVEMEQIIGANRLNDFTKIEIGQMLFIPNTGKIRRVSKSSSRNIKIDLPIKKITETGKNGFAWPVKGDILSHFGQKRDNVTNYGIDIKTKEDDIVVASRDGIVSFCDDKVRGFGKTIIIDHGKGYSTVYAHNSVNYVSAGDKVKRGQAIAKAGKSARSDTAALHFEIRVNEKPRNPSYYLP